MPVGLSAQGSSPPMDHLPGLQRKFPIYDLPQLVLVISDLGVTWIPVRYFHTYLAMFLSNCSKSSANDGLLPLTSYLKSQQLVTFSHKINHYKVTIC